MKKNDRIEVQIEHLTYEGMGVAKVDGCFKTWEKIWLC